MNTEDKASKAFEFWSRPKVIGGFNIALGLIQLVNIWGQEDFVSKLGVLLFGAGFILVGVVLTAAGMRPSWEFYLSRLGATLVVTGVVLKLNDKGPLVQSCVGGGIVLIWLLGGIASKLRNKREPIQTDQPR